MTRDQLAAYYTDLLHQYGPSHRAGDYGSADTQRVRFRVLQRLTWEDLNPPTNVGQPGPIGPESFPTLLDVGCGLGDFVPFAPGPYEGWDIAPELIALARRRRPSTTWQPVTFRVMAFEEGRAVGHADYVVASGLFQFQPAETLRHGIQILYQLCRHGAGFNVLTRAAAEGEYAHEPFDLARWCQTLTPHVVLRVGYLPNDATIFLYRS